MKNLQANSFSRFGFFCLLGFAALNAAMFWQLREPILQGYGDFASFYTAGQIVRAGQSARLYDRALQWNVQQQFASTVKIRRGPLPYIRPPFEALLFLPFACLTYPAAYLTWFALQLMILLAIPFILPAFDEDHRNHSASATKILICLSFFPAAFALIQGQDALLLLLILVLSLRLLLRGAGFQSGAVLALGLFKFHLVLPLLAILILRKKGRLALGFLAVTLLLFCVSLLMVHWSGLVGYSGYLWGLNQAPGLGMVTKPQSMPNSRGLLSVMLQNQPLPGIVHGFLLAIVPLGIIFASRPWRGNDQHSVITAFCFWIVVTLTTSYYSNSYDLTLLLLPLLLLGATFWQKKVCGWPRNLFLAAAGVSLCTPLMWLLALRLDQFGWMVVVLFAMAISLFAAEKFSQQA